MTATVAHPLSTPRRRAPIGPAVLVRHRLPCDLDPERAALVVRDDTRPCVLIGRWAGGGALILSEPVVVAGEDEDPFAVLEAQPVVEGVEGGDGDDHQDGAVGGGWFGRLGFALGRRIERIVPEPPGADGVVPFALAFYDHLLHLDAEGRWWFEALWTPAREGVLRDRLDHLRRRLEDPPQRGPVGGGTWRWRPGPDGHAAAVQACRERIAAGDVFQVNLCTRLEGSPRGAPLDLFAQAAAELRPGFAAFVGGETGDAVASLSPELFLRRRGRHVVSEPIKGTRPRPDEPGAAEREREALAGSGKDRAENVMIADLVRNDLGRVCAYGSVRVPRLAEVEAHPGVWHLVSQVEGELRDGVGDAELLRAAFPPGSVTGAPKIAALHLIAALESTQRQAYTGAIGYAGPLAGLELNVAIRTFELRDGHAWLGVGGAVVADSSPAGEAAECATKAAPLLRAIGGRIAPAAPASVAARTIGHRSLPTSAPATETSRPPLVIAAAPGLPLDPSRPDAAAGVFETLLVRDGRPVELAAHLDRLAAAVAALYGAALPREEAAAIAERHAVGLDRGRLRLTAIPGTDGGPPALDASAAPLSPGSDTPLRLSPVTLPGGLGPYKWNDRRLLETLERRAGPGALPLLVDLDGLVLEASRANVFAVSNDTLVTPPLDGTILPGVTRARVIRRAAGLGIEVQERPLPLAELLGADAIFVTSAIRGVQPVAACLDRTFPSELPVVARLGWRR